MANDVNLYNVNDGLTGRDGGPYLDQEEQRIAEERRAIVEGREPDYDNPGATAGTVLVTATTLVQNAASLNVPSQDNTAVLSEAANALAESDAVSATPTATIPVDVLNDDTEQKAVAEQTPEEAAARPDIGKPVEAEAEADKTESEQPATEEPATEEPTSAFGKS